MAGLCVAGALSAQDSKPAVKKMKTARLLTSEGLKWTDVPELPGARQAVVWGDSTKGAYGMFEKWPGGTAKRGKTYAITPEQIHGAKVQRAAGTTVAEISRAIGCSRGAVARALEG